jgi:hypothetical protein
MRDQTIQKQQSASDTRTDGLSIVISISRYGLSEANLFHVMAVGMCREIPTESLRWPVHCYIYFTLLMDSWLWPVCCYIYFTLLMDSWLVHDTNWIKLSVAK